MPDGTLILYDNSAAPPKRTASRAIQIRLDLNAKTATLVKSFSHPRKLLAAEPGQRRAGCPTATPSSASARSAGSRSSARAASCLFDARLAKGNDTYRAFRFPWSGAPGPGPADGAARTKDGNVTARASWNSATDVARLGSCWPARRTAR